MTSRRTLCALASGALASALVGCAQTNPPLMFGDTTTYGLRLGNETASGGGSVSLGYKAYSLALVPVSILNRDGHPAILRGSDDDGANRAIQADAMSVFASFDNTAGTSGANNASGAASAVSGDAGPVHIGQVFSTGLAAQTLTYAICKKTPAADCGRPPSSAPAGPAADGSARNLASSAMRLRAAANAASASAVASADQPYQKPLLFMRSDVVGIDMGGSLAQQGLQFVLGYGNRNLALIPVAAMGADQEVVPIVGNDIAGDVRMLDTLSVMGQFNANSETAKLNVGMDRYFATGVAARHLSRAMLVTVAGASASEAALPASGAERTASTSSAGAAPAKAGVASVEAAPSPLASR